MKKLTYFLILTLIVFLSACGGGNQNDLEDKKATLKEKKKQLDQISADVRVLEKEIQGLDPNFKTTREDATLVTAIKLKKQSFASYLEVQGTVESEKNIIISSETNGIIRSMPVEEGQFVAQGQLLIAQGSEVVSSQIAEAQTRLDLAEIVFQKRKNLWEQKIGTEIQYLEAKNNVDAIKRQLNTLGTQAGLSNTYAPFSGIVDKIMARRGQNAGPGSPLLRLVSTNQVNVLAEVSESYLGDVKVGDKVKIEFPSLKKEIEAPITRIGETINAENRTFMIEVKLSNPDRNLKPDLLAKVKLKDYTKSEAVIVTTNLIQRDKIGDYIFIITSKDKKTSAKKIYVTRGKTYNNQTEILKGLKGDETLINDGFREVVDGEVLKVIEDERASKLANAK